MSAAEKIGRRRVKRRRDEARWRKAPRWGLQPETPFLFCRQPAQSSLVRKVPMSEAGAAHARIVNQRRFQCRKRARVRVEFF
jgi:hypothetical protein